MRTFFIFGFIILVVFVGLALFQSETVVMEPPEDAYQAAVETVADPSRGEPAEPSVPPSAIKFLPGNAIAQGETLRIVLTNYPEKPSVSFRNEAYAPFSYDGAWNVLIPMAVDAPAGEAMLAVGGTEERIAVEPGDFGTVTINLPKLVTTPEEVAQYQKERKEVAAAYGASVPDVQFAKPFGYPLESIEVTNEFGVTYVDPSDGYRTFHNGVDLRASIGTPVKAINDGTVNIAADHLLEGKFVIVDHGFGIFSDYLHLSELAVSPGDTVAKGQVVGLAGASGSSVGPHLHFIVKVNGVPVNPLGFIKLWERSQ